MKNVPKSVNVLLHMICAALIRHARQRWSVWSEMDFVAAMVNTCV